MSKAYQKYLAELFGTAVLVLHSCDDKAPVSPCSETGAVARRQSLGLTKRPLSSSD